MAEHNSLDELRAYHFSRKKRSAAIIAITAAALFATFTATLMVGNYTIPWNEVFAVLFGGGSPADRQIVMDIRLPRLLCCCLVGAALSLSGLAMQSLFKNPMASPSILGISSGAAFGASLAISFGAGAAVMGTYSVPFMAFAFCFVTMGIVYLIARTKYGVATVTLLLAGVAVGAFFNGLVSLMQYIADEDTLAAIVYWTMGSFNKCVWDSFYLAAVPILLGIAVILFRSRELNLISAGEEQAANMGVNVKRTRILIILGTSLCVGGSVAISGTIGFVGLIVPHIFRMLVGPSHKLLIPLCVFGGAAFMMGIDTISKAAFSVSVPVGILTSLLGAPFFVYVMKTKKKEMWE
ncbi:MAG: iron ABC transporter permease [Candidatus Methanoplasma sp.]|jgi:iron complex transport system permease protein|nr:iron ABC transporter permease [Candidatus Methanoplasma sp.]